MGFSHDRLELLALIGAIYTFIAYLAAFTLEVFFIIDLSKRGDSSLSSLTAAHHQAAATTSNNDGNQNKHQHLANALIPTTATSINYAHELPTSTLFSALNNHNNNFNEPLSDFDRSQIYGAARLALETIQNHITLSCLAASILYFVIFVGSLTLIISLIIRSTFLLLIWICLMGTMCLPELVLVLYVSIYAWGLGSRNGRLELIFYLFRSTLNVIFVLKAHKLLREWNYEKRFFILSSNNNKDNITSGLHHHHHHHHKASSSQLANIHNNNSHQLGPFFRAHNNNNNNLSQHFPGSSSITSSHCGHARSTNNTTSSLSNCSNSSKSTGYDYHHNCRQHQPASYCSQAAFFLGAANTGNSINSANADSAVRNNNKSPRRQKALSVGSNGGQISCIGLTPTHHYNNNNNNDQSSTTTINPIFTGSTMNLSRHEELRSDEPSLYMDFTSRTSHVNYRYHDTSSSSTANHHLNHQEEAPSAQGARGSRLCLSYWANTSANEGLSGFGSQSPRPAAATTELGGGDLSECELDLDYRTLRNQRHYYCNGPEQNNNCNTHRSNISRCSRNGTAGNGIRSSCSNEPSSRFSSSSPIRHGQRQVSLTSLNCCDDRNPRTLNSPDDKHHQQTIRESDNNYHHDEQQNNAKQRVD